MAFSNFELVSTRRAFAEIAADVSALLHDAVDVRLTPIGPYRALLRKHVVRALALQHDDRDPFEILQAFGVEAHRVVDDEQALALIDYRFPDELAERSIARAASVGGLAWHLDAINIAPAWTLLGGRDSIAWGSTVVGQIDTGYTRHPALGFGQSGGSWIRTAECRTFRRVAQADFGPVSPPDPVMDGTDSMLGGPNDGHGTRIGATISGHTLDGDSGAAFFGAAPKVPHVVCRIAESVLIGDQQPALTEALNYLVNDVGVGVVNLSMGFLPRLYTSGLRAALDNAYESGVLFVCAAGNVVDPVVAPAASSRTVAVGGVTTGDRVWSGSSFGPTVDWAAPADAIRRANVDRRLRFSYADGGDGTSYATALTTAAAALWLTHRRADIAARYPQPWQRAAAFLALGRAIARRPALWQDGVVGTGILDVGALLTAPLPPADRLVKEPPAG